jgi:hypothetical protein
MRLVQAISVSFILALAACGQAAGPADADAQTSGALTDSDKAAIMRTLDFRADSNGQVENACGSQVAPQFSAVDLGGDVGTAQLVLVPGGENSPTCYGDGPGALMLVRRDGAGFRQIYMNQGGFLAVLATETNGVRDLAHVGPGFQHPMFTWNGNEYVPAGRAIADADMSDATILP